MGYPGKNTDDVLDIVHEMISLAEDRNARPDYEETMGKLETELVTILNYMDNSFGEYAESINRS